MHSFQIHGRQYFIVSVIGDIRSPAKRQLELAGKFFVYAAEKSTLASLPSFDYMLLQGNLMQYSSVWLELVF